MWKHSILQVPHQKKPPMIFPSFFFLLFCERGAAAGSVVEVSVCLSAEHQTGSQAEDSHRTGVSGETTTDSARRTEDSSANDVILFFIFGGGGWFCFFWT